MKDNYNVRSGQVSLLWGQQQSVKQAVNGDVVLYLQTAHSFVQSVATNTPLIKAVSYGKMKMFIIVKIFLFLLS